VLVPATPPQPGEIAAGREPRRDYVDLADALRAELIVTSPRRAGPLPAAFSAALTAFRRRDHYDLIVTLNERTGVPLAILFALARVRRRHLMIAHWVSPLKKGLPLRLLRSSRAIDRIVVFGTAQERVALGRLGWPRDRVTKVLHAADHHFWHPLGLERSGICAAGLEHRDYPTLLDAIRGLDVQLVIAAASPWSADHGLGRSAVPPNVTMRRCSHVELRELYDRSEFVVVPLQDVDFQAGSLVLYEAMAMGKAVIATRTRAHAFGDIVRDGETGILVAPGDAQELRSAISRLLRDPAEARRLGSNARRIVEAGLNHDEYIRRMVEIATELGRGAQSGSRRRLDPREVEGSAVEPPLSLH
jgi:glycosyltransferase involved in cell wall biosynthesis